MSIATLKSIMLTAKVKTNEVAIKSLIMPPYQKEKL